MIARFCRLARSVSVLSHSRLLSGLGSRESPRHTGEIPKYVRDPIPLYTTGLGPFHRPISSTNKEAQAFFDQGFQMHVRLRAPRRDPLVPRSVEARSRLRDLLLGRGLGVGLVSERPDVRRSVAVRLRRDAEGDQPARQGHADRARVHRRAGGALRQEFRRRETQGAGPGLRRRDGQGRRAVSRRISTPSRSMPTRCSCSSRAAARATSTRRTSSGCTACSNRR